MRIPLLPVLAVAGLLFAAPEVQAQPRRPEIGRYAKGYKGAEGVRVTILRVGNPDLNEALVRVSGVDHPLDRVILKVKVEKKYSNRGNSYEYTMTWQKKPWVLIAADDPGPGRRSYYLFLPGEWTYQGRPEQGHPLHYDEGVTQETNPEHFLTEYLEKHANTRF